MQRQLSKFRKTELGEIPEEWKIINIERLTDILDSQRIPIKESDRRKREGKIPYYGATGIIDYIDDFIFNEKLLCLAEDGENLRSNVLPNAFTIEGKTWVNNHAHVLRPLKEIINHEYLLYFLNFIKLDAYLSFTAQPKLTQDSMRKIKTIVPSLKEQQKIASILSNVDELIQKTEQIIEKTQRLKKGLINKLVIQGLDIKNNLYQKIPEKHQYRKLTEVVKVNPSYKLEKDKEYAFVEMAAINEKTKSISYCIKRKPSSGYAIFKNDDTLFARITPCTENGKTCLVKDINGYGLGSTELIVLNPGNEILPEFLCYYCQTDKVRNHSISQMGGATGRQRVPYKVFTEDLFILLPSKEIQEKIVNCIKTIEEIIKLKTDEKKQIQNLKKGLMQQLLTGKLRVKV